MRVAVSKRMLPLAEGHYVAEDAISQVIGLPSSDHVTVVTYDGKPLELKSEAPVKDAAELAAIVQGNRSAKAHYQALPQDDVAPVVDSVPNSEAIVRDWIVCLLQVETDGIGMSYGDIAARVRHEVPGARTTNSSVSSYKQYAKAAHRGDTRKAHGITADQAQKILAITRPRSHPGSSPSRARI